MTSETIYVFIILSSNVLNKYICTYRQTRKGHLPDKHFMERNSLLTDLFEVKHIQTIYHIFLAILFGLVVNTGAYDLLHKGQ